jgi:hypothetical protein
VYRWNAAKWSGAWVDSYTWQSDGAVMKSVNSWTATLADFKMVDELTVPIIRQFGELKQTQALLLYNVTSKALSTLACACGNAEREGCFDDDKINDPQNAPVSGTTTALCGDDQQQKTGFGTANVQKAACEAADSRRRRLDSGGSSDEEAKFTWTHHSAGSTSACLEPFSSSTDRTQLNPLVLKNGNNVVYGQLLGDGKGFTVTGTFTSTSLCLSLRNDIRSWKETFPVIDVGFQHKENSSIDPLFMSMTFNDSTKFCFKTTSEGVYFPIRRVALNTLADAAALSCGRSCVENRHICVYNGTTSASTCVCKCGFSGDTCNTGCLN